MVQNDSPVQNKSTLFRAPSPIIDLSQQSEPVYAEPVNIHQNRDLKKGLFSPREPVEEKFPSARAVSPPLPASRPNRRNMPPQGGKISHLFLVNLLIFSPEPRPSAVADLDPDHPIIKNLQNQTAQAREEAQRARQGTSAITSLKYVNVLYSLLLNI